MMKFIFFLFMGGASLVVGGLNFWLLSGSLCFLLVLFVLNNLMFTSFSILSFSFSVDMVSFVLILLSIKISLFMLYSSYGVYSSKNSVILFSLSIISLCLILVFTFTASNLLSFYFYFEASLIPTMLIIMGWGYQPERLQAGIYFMFYTLTASLPLLLVLLYEGGVSGTHDFCLKSFLGLSMSYSFYLFVFFTLAFLVKMPMFFTHLWLPKAHVEAPVSGSMILAGVLLKLGGYGFYRVIMLCQGGLKIYGSYIFGLSVLGMTYVGLICCRLNDLKALVAYSSVAHMGLVICGIFSSYLWGFSGGLMMMVGHGLVSSGLFCIVNMYYERSSSRSIYLNKGLILMMPSMSLFIFMLSAANMAAPPTLSLMSEIFLMISILKFDKIMLLFFPLGSYLGAVFTLFLFSFSQHGKIYKLNYSFLNSNLREYHILFLHILPVNFLFLKPEYFLFML